MNGEDYNHYVDWWSLGIIAYCLLVGNYPVSGYEDHVSMKTAVDNCLYPIPETASNAVKSLLIGLLEKNPTNRLNALHKLRKEELFMNIDLDEVKEKKVGKLK